jgi:S-adenosylmethionine:tRNA ribosyltransferase-isomerase
MLSDYDYTLPEELIAQEPLADRASSRLLWLHNNDGIPQAQNGTPAGGEGKHHATITHQKFPDIVNILQSGDLLIMNDTRVTALRLMGRKGIHMNVRLCQTC